MSSAEVLDLSKSFESNEVSNNSSEMIADTLQAKTLKFRSDTRLSTPKPVLHIGASTEVSCHLVPDLFYCFSIGSSKDSPQPNRKLLTSLVVAIVELVQVSNRPPTLRNL